MRGLASFATVAALAACPSPPRPDAGLPDAAAPDSGQADAGPPDGGAPDSGQQDAGLPDAGELTGCNALYRALLDPVRAGQLPQGAVAVGAGDPGQVLVIDAGTTFTGDLYVFNQARVLVAPGARTTLNGSVYLADDAQFEATGADLVIGQQFAGQYPVIAIDRARYVLGQSQVSLGALPAIILPVVLCGAARLTATASDIEGTLDPFALDQASVTLSAVTGGFEVTLSDGAHATLSGITAPSFAGLYFTLRGTLGTLPVLRSSSSVTQNVAFPPGPSGQSTGASITASNVFYGVWVEPGASLTLADSNLGLFLTFREGAATAQGLHSGTFASGSLAVTDRSVSLSNTTIAVINAYLSAPSTDAGVLDVQASTLGEHNCHGPAGTRCLLGAGTTVDGSGGSLRAEDFAELVFTGAGVATAGITTFVTAVGHSTARLRNTAITAGTAHPSVWLDAFDAALISLEDSVVGAQVPLRAHDDATIAQAWVASPAEGATVSGSVVVGGIAQLVTASPASPHAFASYTLSYSAAGGGARTVITTSTSPVNAFGALGTWNVAALAPGSYRLHLTLNDAAGPVTELTHTVTR